MDNQERLGLLLAARFRDGDIVGFGTGTTLRPAARAVAVRVQHESFRLYAVPTSQQSMKRLLGSPASSSSRPVNLESNGLLTELTA